MKRMDWLAIGIIGLLFIVMGQLIGSIKVLVTFYVNIFPIDNVPFAHYITPYTLLGTIISGLGAVTGAAGFIKALKKTI